MPAPAQEIAAYGGAAVPAAPAQEAAPYGAAGPSPQGLPDTPARDAPDESAWGAFGLPAQQAPSRDSWPGADRTVAGLPMRTPGANMISGSARSRTGGSPVIDEAQAPGQRAGSYETEQVTPPRGTPLPRRSPELARARLSGFQLGSREAEAQAPSAGEGANR
jgi:hypothetical protein